MKNCKICNSKPIIVNEVSTNHIVPIAVKCSNEKCIKNKKYFLCGDWEKD